jgi:hypothetical protein
MKNYTSHASVTASSKPGNRADKERALGGVRKQSGPKSRAFALMFGITLIWGVVIIILLLLHDSYSGTGESAKVTEVEQGSNPVQLQFKFTDENGLGQEENREVMQLAAEVVRLVEERGFKVGEVIVPKGYLREFDLLMGRGEVTTDVMELPASIRLRCSTTRLASATAADAIHVFDLWLDGSIHASEYIDLRTPRRAFYQ